MDGYEAEASTTTERWRAMQSLWDYLRTRTRDSMLAGMQDALESVEGEDSGIDEQEAAKRLLERHRGQAQLPGTERIADKPVTDEPASPEQSPLVKIQPTPTVDPLAAKIADQMRDDTRQLDAFDRRLQQTNPALSPPPAVPTARKRGRPRKNP